MRTAAADRHRRGRPRVRDGPGDPRAQRGRRVLRGREGRREARPRRSAARDLRALHRAARRTARSSCATPSATAPSPAYGDAVEAWRHARARAATRRRCARELGARRVRRVPRAGAIPRSTTARSRSLEEILARGELELRVRGRAGHQQRPGARRPAPHRAQPRRAADPDHDGPAARRGPARRRRRHRRDARRGLRVPALRRSAGRHLLGRLRRHAGRDPDRGRRVARWPTRSSACAPRRASARAGSWTPTCCAALTPGSARRVDARRPRRVARDARASTSRRSAACACRPPPRSSPPSVVTVTDSSSLPIARATTTGVSAARWRSSTSRARASCSRRVREAGL